MKVFCLPNLNWLDVEQKELPTELPVAPYSKLDDRPTKSEFRAWSNDKATRHAFFSCVEGINPSARITVENPPFKMNGLVLDYDATLGQDGIDAIQKNGMEGMLPRWVSRTFSNHFRVVWEFEKPIMVDNEEITDRFMRLLGKALKVRNILPGLDEQSFKRAHYFEAGFNWQEIPNSTPIPSATLSHLFVKAATEKVLRGDGPSIPMDVIAAEVETRWPERVQGEFVEGSRQPLFWIPDGIDRIGAQVGQYGMLCYSERAGKSFVHWGEILGQPFVQKFEAERIGNAAEGLWFDSQRYWTLEEDKHWSSRNKDDTIMHLKVKGVSARLLPKAESSDAEKVLVTAQKLRTVKGAAPLVHDSREIVTISGERYLNISTIKVMQPAETGNHNDFPWLSAFFANVWDDPKQAQHDHFMGWLQHYYVAALQGRPAQGQAIIIAGPPSAGKTFFNYRILGEIMGGFSDATNFLMGKTNFNKADSEVALWSCDDTRGASSWENKAAFSAAIKKHVANPQIRVEGKNQNAFTIPWLGRIVITCNTNKESLEIIPQLDNTIKDKLSLFWWTDKWKAKFLPVGGTEAVVKQELPFFLRWLVDWKAPASVMNDDPRFAVNSYHHPKMLEHAHESSSSARFTELLDLFLENLPKETKENEIWASPAKIRKLLSEDPSARDALKEFNRNRMGAALEALEYPHRRHAGSTEYQIWTPPEEADAA